MKNTFESPQNEEHIFQMVEQHTQQQRRAEMCKELYSVTVGQSGDMPNTQYFVMGKEQAKACVKSELEYFAEAWRENEHGNIIDEFTVEQYTEFYGTAVNNWKTYPIDWHVSANPFPPEEWVGKCAWCEKDLKAKQVGEIDGENLICKECLH